MKDNSSFVTYSDWVGGWPREGKEHRHELEFGVEAICNLRT